MKKTIITVLFFTMSISIMSAQNEEVSTQGKDTTSIQTQAPNIEEISLIVQDKDTSIQDQIVNYQDIIDIKKGLNQLLTMQVAGQVAGYEQVMDDYRKTPMGRTTVGIRTDFLYSVINDHFQTINVRFNFGYYVASRLFISFIVDFSTGLFYDNSTTSPFLAPTLSGGRFNTNIALGGEIGYDILKTKIGNLDLRASSATTVFRQSDYKFTSIDVGLYWNIGLKADMTRSTFGIGVRYYDSKTSHYNNDCTIFMSVGFKL